MSRVGGGVGRDVVRKASTQQSELQCSGWAAMVNEKDTTLTAITLGSKYFSYVRSPAPSHSKTPHNLFEPLQIKWEVNILLRKSSCVFITACVVYYCVCLFIVSLWCWRWQYNNSFLSVCSAHVHLVSTPPLSLSLFPFTAIFFKYRLVFTIYRISNFGGLSSMWFFFCSNAFLIDLFFVHLLLSVYFFLPLLQDSSQVFLLSFFPLSLSFLLYSLESFSHDC